MESTIVATASRADVAVSLVRLTPTMFEGRRIPTVFLIVVAHAGELGTKMHPAAHPRATLDRREAGELFQAACDFWKVTP